MRRRLTAVTVVVVLLFAGPGAAAADSRLEPGDEGGPVVLWQKMLNMSLEVAGPSAPDPLVEDGVFGPLTGAATRWLERRSGSTVDGVVSARDRRMALSGFLACCGALKPMIGPGDWGPLVGHVQLALNRRLRSREEKLRPLVLDLEYGPLTETAVRLFQEANGLHPDGVVGPHTWRAFFGASRP